jgi:hypothetical protein|tara:strand:+ start:291 stop:449 length:159 start_codon:yes stop_codon:yes gene_type:complete
MFRLRDYQGLSSAQVAGFRQEDTQQRVIKNSKKDKKNQQRKNRAKALRRESK